MDKDFNEYETKPIANQTTPVWELVITDMQARDKKGRSKYNMPLIAHNGRDPLVDLYQELLDSVVYLRQLLTEKYGE